jgi:hypothetical protein
LTQHRSRDIGDAAQPAAGPKVARGIAAITGRGWPCVQITSREWRRVAPCSNYDRAVPECLSCGFATGVTPATTMLESDKAIAVRDVSSREPIAPRRGHPDASALATVGSGQPMTRLPA